MDDHVAAIDGANFGHRPIKMQPHQPQGAALVPQMVMVMGPYGQPMLVPLAAMPGAPTRAPPQPTAASFANVLDPAVRDKLAHTHAGAPILQFSVALFDL